ncbi:MAG: DUF4440 domain-containing protein [Chthonomonadales bacterium]|nr:DUF4440 domain-containing protein [Chthonomonadales bacterium]
MWPERAHRRLALAAVLVAIWAAAPAAAAPSLKARIQKRYDALNAAARKKDLKGLLAFYTPDYRATDTRGRTTSLATLRKQVAQMLGSTESLSGATRVLRVQAAGGGAVVVADGLSRIVYRDPKSGRKTVLVARTTDRDTWVRVRGTWRIRATRSLKLRLTRDGKPVALP